MANVYETIDRGQCERVKLVREALGLNQREFANRIGISPPNISLIERKLRSPGKRILNAICDKFDVNFRYMVNGQGEMFRDEKNHGLVARLTDPNINPVDLAFVESYMQLSEPKREVIRDLLKTTYERAQEIENNRPPKE